MNVGKDSVAARNRAAMPALAAWVDGLRAVFGRVRVRHLREGGHELGKLQDDGQVMDAVEWLAWVKDGTVPPGKPSPMCDETPPRPRRT